MGGFRIRRVQQKGHERKYPLRTADPDSLSGFEKIVKSTGSAVLTEPGRVAASARIERRIDMKSPEVWKIGQYLAELDVSNNPRDAKKKPYRINNLDRLTVTYFGSRVMLPAIQAKYRNFGQDIASTNDVLIKLRSSFADFVKASLVVQNEFEEPMYAEQYFRNIEEEGLLVKPYNPRESKWRNGHAAIHPRLARLNTNYLTFDLSSNEYLEEEMHEIKDFLRIDEGLNVEIPKFDNRPGNPTYIIHSTVAEVATAELQRRKPVYSPAPSYLPLKQVQLSTGVWES